MEVDETYVGGSERLGSKRGRLDKPPVVALVERGGKVRAFADAKVSEANLRPQSSMTWTGRRGL